MSFREKSAWAMALLMLASGGVYLWLAFTLRQALGAAPPPLAPLVPYVILVVCGSVAVQIILALVSPGDAQAPADERERLIAVRAGHVSGLILATGVVAALGVYIADREGDLLFHLVVGSLIVSQFTEYLLQILGFRRIG